MGERQLTKDGFEKTFQVNHLAPFLLTSLLLPTLTTSSAKVLQTSSVAVKNFGKIDLDDLQNERDYSPNNAYGDAKLANILFTKELHHRYHDQGISAAAFHPGNVATNFASDTTSWFRFIYGTPLKRLALITSNKGAEALIWLVDGTPGSTWELGEYYEKKKLAQSSDQANNAELVQQRWNCGKTMLNL